MIYSKIENLIFPYRERISADYIHYRNHVHRIVNYTLELKEDIKVDDEEKIVIAAIFHDIGMWTTGSFDYLKPSIAEAVRYLTEHGKVEWTEEITLMINMHHKLTEYNGVFADNVEAFRKADLIDLTKGLKRFDLSRGFLSKIIQIFQWAIFEK